MKIRPEEISSVIKKEIEAYESDLDVEEVGTILEVGDGIARVYGLKRAMAGEMLLFPGEVYGLALNLEENTIGAVVLGDYLELKEGDTVKRTGRVLEVPVGEGLLGRIVDPMGRPIDAKGPIAAEDNRKVDIRAPGVVERQPVKEPLQTGLKAIDSMVPIGRGQRERAVARERPGPSRAIPVSPVRPWRLPVTPRPSPGFGP